MNIIKALGGLCLLTFFIGLCLAAAMVVRFDSAREDDIIWMDREAGIID